MLRRRLATGIPLAVVVVLAIVWPGLPGAFLFLILSAALLVATVSEFFALMRAIGHPGHAPSTMAFGLLLFVAAALTPPGAPGGVLFNRELGSLIMCAFLIVGFVRVFRRWPSRGALTEHLVSIAGFVYICWTLSFIPKLYFSSGLGSSGRYLAVFLIAVAKLGDVGAFAAGTLSARSQRGNHKLIPSLSPKKSWEGVFGGVGASVLCALVLLWILREKLVFGGVPVLGLRSALFLGVLFPLLGLVGDLGESALKRAAGVKDSGQLPGLGGALDVMDSLILVAPVFYYYVQAAAYRAP